MRISFQHLNIQLSTPLIVAVSGGPDSVALLQALKLTGFKQMIVAHLDHGIRQTSYQDSQLVRTLSSTLDCCFEHKRLNIKSMMRRERKNLEALARQERYEFFRELKEKHQAKYIVTAHHANDQVETVLMNLIRGCGLEGLSGIKELDGDLWRPLLTKSKDELLNYCVGKKLSYIQDQSNEDIRYRRNFLRKKVIPQLKILNPNLLETMHNNIRLWEQASEYFKRKARSFLSQHRNRLNRYTLIPFLALPDFEQQYVLRSLFEKTHGHKQNLVQDHLDQILKILRQNISGKQKEFGKGKVLIRRKKFFEISDK